MRHEAWRIDQFALTLRKDLMNIDAKQVLIRCQQPQLVEGRVVINDPTIWTDKQHAQVHG